MEDSGHMREEVVLALEEAPEVVIEVVGDVSPDGVPLELAHPQVLVLAEELPKKVVELLEEGVGQVLQLLSPGGRRVLLLLTAFLHFVDFGLAGLPYRYSADHVADGQVVEVLLVLSGLFGRHDEGVGGRRVDLLAGFEGELAVLGEGGPPGGVEVGDGRGPLLVGLCDHKSVPLHPVAAITK